MAPRAPLVRLLVVDDDAGLVALMADALRDEGYEVTTARSGAEALDRLERAAPDLMLLDLKMRDMGGPAVLRRLKTQDASIPFVVITGQGDEGVAVELMKRGFQHADGAGRR